MKIEPATLHRTDDPRLVGLVNALTGEKLVCARYAVPAGVDWENNGGLEYVHEVDLGVELITESGMHLELSWATPGRDEGLSMALEDETQHTRNELVDLVDVSDNREWTTVLGRAVELVVLSFHVHNDDSSDRPWSFRIGASGGSCVTISLGEICDHSLCYMPDNLVVVFDERTARSYEIPSSRQSAWGTTI
jgi:hypothetical protein